MELLVLLIVCKAIIPIPKSIEIAYKKWTRPVNIHFYAWEYIPEDPAFCTGAAHFFKG